MQTLENVVLLVSQFSLKPKYSPVLYNLSVSETFLVTFAKLRKATISFVMSVCPSAWNKWLPMTENLSD